MKRLFVPLLITVLFIVGITLVAYPFAASWITQYNQSQVVNEYSKQIDNVRPDKNQQLEAAHRYNEALNAGAELGANEHVATGTGELNPSYEAAAGVWPYTKILTADHTGLMGRIKIPSIDVDLPIFHGTADDTLLKGAGHLEGTSLPVGGDSTRAVITAHRGLAEARMFTDLNKVKAGDTFTLEIFGDVLTYRVRDTKVVAPEETDSLRVEEGKDLVTLVTCTPLGINSHRILVTGERIIPTPQADIDAAGKDSELPRFPWWALAYGAAFAAVSAFFISTVVREKRRKNRARAGNQEKADASHR